MLEALAIDTRGHHPSCPKHAKDDAPTADQNGTHVDLFCECHANQNPRILKNGTDIAWPAGWSEAEAGAWRSANGLERPS